jgi:hypothetical protein
MPPDAWISRLDRAVIDWDDIDRRLEVAGAFVLNDEERQEAAAREQAAFDANLPRIRELLEAHEQELKQRGFWTELLVESTGLRFRYSCSGFYGPGGFSSQFHVHGPLVLGVINPLGDAIASFYANDLDKNIFIGERFDEIAFTEFVGDNLRAYVAPENQIVSVDNYEWIKEMLESSAAS